MLINLDSNAKLFLNEIIANKCNAYKSANLLVLKNLVVGKIMSLSLLTND